MGDNAGDFADQFSLAHQLGVPGLGDAKRGKTQTQDVTGTSSGTVTSTPAGYQAGQDLLPFVSQFGQDVAGQQAYGGTFVPQRTATDAPLQTSKTHVDPNYAPGIQSGLDAASTNAGAIPGLVSQGFSRWGDTLAGPGQNPAMEDLINAFQRDAQESYQLGANSRAQMAGAQGAFGGTPYAQNEAFATEQAQDSINKSVSGLRLEDFYNSQNMLLEAPGAIGGLANLGTLPAQQELSFGNMGQENQAAAAGTADENAQRTQNNLWQSMGLNDANTLASVQDSLARYQSGQELTEQQIAQLEQLMSVARGAPGGTTTSSGTQTGQTVGGTQGADWKDIAGIFGAIMQGVGASERSLKTGIEDLGAEVLPGVRLYAFRYKADPFVPHVGVMADELEPVRPDLVLRRYDGTRMVNYDGLREAVNAL